LFRTVQLAVAVAQQHGATLGLAVGSTAEELFEALAVDAAERDQLRQAAQALAQQQTPPPVWRDPRTLELLPQLLRLAAEQRRVSAMPVLDRLEETVDRFHTALHDQQQSEARRLHERKLSAL